MHGTSFQLNCTHWWTESSWYWCSAPVLPKGFKTSDIWRLPFGRHFYPKPAAEWNSVTEQNLLIIQLTKCSPLDTVQMNRASVSNAIQFSAHLGRERLRTFPPYNSLIFLTLSILFFSCIAHCLMFLSHSVFFCFVFFSFYFTSQSNSLISVLSLSFPSQSLCSPSSDRAFLCVFGPDW